jgi:signal peptidase I
VYILACIYAEESIKSGDMKKILKVLIIILIVLIVLLVATRLAGYRAMRYPADVGSSMYPTITPGDSWLCKMKSGYTAKELQPGMVIMFPQEDYKFFLTKRIIALENQILTIKGRETFVNGERIEEPYAYYSGEKPSGINVSHETSEVTSIKIPEGKLFVMGDNRDNSFDSRDPEFGFIDVEDIVGQPIFILWAQDKSRIGKSVK